MRAFGIPAPGGDLVPLDLPVPQPAANELLVRVEGSSINPVDVYVVRGTYRSSDLDYPAVPGFDFSGVVEEVGDGVTSFAVGDAVMGCWSRPHFRNGAWADYVTVPVETAVVRRPATLAADEAAALPLAGLTAALAVDDVAPAPGETVLVVGAGGAVGCYVVQLAARRGANVIATAKPRDDQRLRELGAAETIDYTRCDVASEVRTRFAGGIAVLIDIVNDRPELNRLCELVADGGRVSSARFAVDRKLLAARGILAKNVRANDCGPEPLAPLVALAEAGELSILVSSVRRRDELPAAIEEFERGGQGKIAISFEPNGRLEQKQ